MTKKNEICLLAALVYVDLCLRKSKLCRKSVKKKNFWLVSLTDYESLWSHMTGGVLCTQTDLTDRHLIRGILLNIYKYKTLSEIFWVSGSVVVVVIIMQSVSKILNIQNFYILRREEKPTRCHWILYYTYMLNMFRALLCPSSGARDYMCVL